MECGCGKVFCGSCAFLFISLPLVFDSEVLHGKVYDIDACKGEYPHRVGEYVCYKNNGICKIVDIVTREFAGMEPKTYYEMEMVFDNHTVLYVPVDSPALERGMRHVLSPQEIHSVIADSEQYQDLWIEDEKARTAKYEALLEEGDRGRILWLVKTLSLHKIEAEQNKKKLHAADTKILETAEKIIKEEFAFALGIEKEQVIPYILDQLQNRGTA